MNERQVHVLPSVGELQEAAARQVAEILTPTTAGKSVRIALSGGSTPRRMHELLADMPGINWSHVHVYFGDERTVGPDDPRSNYRMARETLLDRVPIPAGNVHRMRGEDPPAAAAAAYQQELIESFASDAGALPRFDLIILGMGADGHTASLFPGSTALHERSALVIANDVPQQSTTRITLTYPVLNAARQVLFLVAGGDKAPAIRDVLGEDETRRPPAAFVLPTDGESLWLLDAAAAEGLSEAR